MNEFMTAAAQQFETEGEEQLPIFRDEDIEMAINRVTTPEEQFSQIERKYGIPRDVMERLEQNFVGITHEALIPAKNPTEYQKALQQLLDLVEETLIMNQKTMPYEHQGIPTKLPIRVAQMIYPDFEPTKSENQNADVIAEAMEVAKHNSPESIRERAQIQQNLTAFFEAEERRLDPEYDKKKQIREQALFEASLADVPADEPDDVVTSVRGGVTSLLQAVPAKAADREEIDLTDDIEVVYEDAPSTTREERKTA